MMDERVQQALADMSHRLEKFDLGSVIAVSGGNREDAREILKDLWRNLGRPLANRCAILEMAPAILRQASNGLVHDVVIRFDSGWRYSGVWLKEARSAMGIYQALAMDCGRRRLGLVGSERMRFWQQVSIVPGAPKTEELDLEPVYDEEEAWGEMLRWVRPADPVRRRQLERLDQRLETLWLECLALERAEEAGCKPVFENLGKGGEYYLAVDESSSEKENTRLVCHADHHCTLKA